MLDVDVERKAQQGLKMAATTYLGRGTLTADCRLLETTPFFDSALTPFPGAALTLASDEMKILMITQIGICS